MSVLAIKTIIEAEDEARQAKSEMQEKADFAVMETDKAGREAVAATLARAEDEVAHLLSITDRKATDEARVLASNTANRQAAQRARAERLLDSAAELIVERIVKG